ncbi:copper chaperone PCu(A)C [Aquifex aeolicus]|nr:copper chaperone PCu(A)C [Aquifex aeolicus]
MRKLLTLIVVFVALSFGAPKIVVKHPWVMEPPPGPNTTMMGMIIVNEGDEPDYLIGAKTDIAQRVELHKTVIENDVAKMVPQERIEIPPKGKVEFKHHGYHVMIIGLKKRIKEGDKVKVELIFEKSGKITVEAPVVKKHRMKHHMHH